jgi:dipeptidyl aminopeptidase/acylaminoacyl peptidase
MEYFGNYFWDNDQLYLQRSPIFHTKNITTPLLIISGADDDRVPSTQAYEIYNALNLQHKTVKMLLLPKQGHVPTDAHMIEESVREINQWLVKYSIK